MEFRWITDGIEALSRIRSLPDRQAYYCPLCLKGFRDWERTLTREDAPPASIGGRPVAITCATCNHSAGAEIDVHIAHDRVWTEIAEGRRPFDATLQIDDTTTSAEILRPAVDEYHVFLAPARSNPADTEKLSGVLGACHASDAPLEGTFVPRTPGPDSHRLRVAWLKSAYVLSFAALGYSYILRPALARVREQISHPDDDLQVALVIRDSGKDTATRQIVAVEEPEGLRSLVVMIGERLVFLPPAWGPDNHALAAALGASLPGRVDFAGKGIAWPTRPTYALDMQRPPRP